MVNIILIHPDMALTQVVQSAILPKPDWFLFLHEANYEAFMERFPKRAQIDIAIIDSTEIDHMRDLQALSIGVKIIVLCNVVDELEAMRAFHRGAVGYGLNTNFQKTGVHFLQPIIAGGALISPSIGRHILDTLVIPISRKRSTNFDLTPNEVKIIQLLSDGCSYDNIVSIMGISKNGVRYHLKKIYIKLNVKNRVFAVHKWNNRLQPIERNQDSATNTKYQSSSEYYTSNGV